MSNIRARAHDLASRAMNGPPLPPDAGAMTARARRSRRLTAGALAGVLGVGLFAASLGPGGAQRQERGAPLPLAGTLAGVGSPAPGPQPARRPAGIAGLRDRVDSARGWAEQQPGLVSFAIVGRDGVARGHHEHATYPAASTVKAMLLAAELRRLAGTGAELDSGTRALLEPMITVSDNDTATAVHARVGDDGLRAVAARAGMEDFDVAGHWGTAALSAADLALLFANLDRAFPGRFEEYGKGLLGSVSPEQSWGLPPAAGSRAAVRFKGGWRPTDQGYLVHQAGEVRRDGRDPVAVAVLTDGQPSMEHGIGVVEGIGSRLLGR